MSEAASDYTLAELCIVAAAEAFRHDGEVLAIGIGVIPRLAASLAMKTFNPDLMMTDAGAFLLSEPNPIGPLPADFRQANETWMGLARIVDSSCSGQCHAMLEPAQIDRFGQVNASATSANSSQSGEMPPGARSFAGSAISRPSSFFMPAHNPRTFPAGECDYVSSIGFNPARLPKGCSLDDIDIRRVITDLCVMDFGGPGHQLRLLTLHPGITVRQVQDHTGFQLTVPAAIPTTPAPTAAQLAILAALDPHNQRATQIAGDPPGQR